MRTKQDRKRSSSATIPRPLNVASPYPWAVTEALVRHLSDVQLRDLMRELLIAEAYRSGADVSEVQVNAETKAGDDGADGLSSPSIRRLPHTAKSCRQRSSSTVA